MKMLLGCITLCLLALPLWGDYSRDQSMTLASLNGIDLAYTQTGETEHPAVLMIMGLTGSHRLWGDDIVNRLVDAGYRVVLFDNRDTGDSARLDELGTPTIWWEMLKSVIGIGVDAPYTLRDMADDGLAVLDELGIEQAHIVGASMGGMIAQIIAAENPDRVLSLVSIMSTTGAEHLPQGSAESQDGLMDIADSEEDAARQLNDIGIYPEAMPRQLMAIVEAGDRSEQVKTISVPTLVQHGVEDTLLPLPHGEHTHELIEGSVFKTYEGMGHDLPEDVIPLVVADMVSHFTR